MNKLSTTALDLRREHLHLVSLKTIERQSQKSALARRENMASTPWAPRLSPHEGESWHQIRARTVGQPQLNHCAVSLCRCRCCTRTHSRTMTKACPNLHFRLIASGSREVGLWSSDGENTRQPNTCGRDQMVLAGKHPELKADEHHNGRVRDRERRRYKMPWQSLTT